MDTLQLFVDNTHTTVNGPLRGELYKEFKRELGYQPEDALWRMQSNPHWDGYTTTVCWNRQHCRCAIKRDGVHFPTGLISKAVAFLRGKGLNVEIHDARDPRIAACIQEIPYHLTDTLVIRDKDGKILLNPDGTFQKGKPFAPYEYQKDAIDKAIAQQRGIIKISTGGGKTCVASGIISKLGVTPSIFYVTSVDLLKQAYDEFTQYIRLNNMPIKIGRVGGGFKEIADLTVMTVQTAVKALDGKWAKFDDDDESDNTDISDIKLKIVELIQNAKLIICDECITGDATVITKHGPVRMKELSAFVGKELQSFSFSGNSVVWKKITHFQPKGRRKTLKISLSNGKHLCCTADHPVKTIQGWIPAAAIQKGTLILCLAKMPENPSLLMSNLTFPHVCNTNYVTVDSVESHGEEEVFDIQIEDTHCFFANTLLVHNCQHMAAETCQLVADNSLNARWRYGMSATPWRDKGDDILIDACFGKPIVDISASWLIQNGFLVKPNIAFIKMNNMAGERLGAYPSVYKTAIVENTYRNMVVAKLATNLQEQGRCVLVLVQQIAHGMALQEMIPDSVFLHGSCTKKTREKHIDLMRSGKAPITIASTIFDEGIDVKPLNALILAGGGKSPTRALQRIGRVIRQYTYPNGEKKKDAFVYDFHDVQKYVSAHASARRKIYRSEPEFVIEDFEI